LLVFPLVAFLVLWLAYAFLVGQAPDYPRMLIVLPFVACLVVEGVRFLAGLAARLSLVRPRLATAVPAVAVLLAIGVWNGFIGWDFIDKGRAAGDDIGSTGRYVERHSRNPNEHFYLAADQSRFPYFVWGWPSIWEERLRMFSANDAQVGGVINPTAVGTFSAQRPFVVFMRSDLWSRSAPDFMAHYPQARTDKITPDGRLVAVDVS
jgi:hypothetical protein